MRIAYLSIRTKTWTFMPNLIIQRYLDFTTIIWVCNYIAGNMCTFKETVQIDFMQSYKKLTLQNLKSSRQSCRHLSEGLKKSDIIIQSYMMNKFKVKIFANFYYISFKYHQNRYSCIKNINPLQWQMHSLF